MTAWAPDLARLYREARARVTGLLTELDAAGPAALDAAVPCCPGWSARDVLAHLTAVCEDALAGRLTGIPTEEQTAGQVRRMAGCELAEVLNRWAAAAPPFEAVVGSSGIWPAVIDVVSHEQDLRGAVGRPGARACAGISLGAGWLLAGLRPPVPLRVVVEDREFRVGPASGSAAGPAAGPELTLVTTRYEAFRWRMGRRSRAQLAVLDWSGDPAGHLAVFGPATCDIIE
ncbi:MAG: maleylpyruvate isomerase N-terminal domain-containing protein [Streptosporangiaceae bacterium]